MSERLEIMGEVNIPDNPELTSKDKEILGANLDAYQDAKAEAQRALDALMSGEMPEDMSNEFDMESKNSTEAMLDSMPLFNDDDQENVNEYTEVASLNDPIESNVPQSYPVSPRDLLEPGEDVPSLEQLEAEVIQTAANYEKSLYDTTVQQNEILAHKNRELEDRLNKALTILEQNLKSEQEEYIGRLEHEQKMAFQEGNLEKFQRLQRALSVEYAKSTAPTSTASTFQPHQHQQAGPIPAGSMPQYSHYVNHHTLPANTTNIQYNSPNSYIPPIYSHIYQPSTPAAQHPHAQTNNNHPLAKKGMPQRSQSSSSGAAPSTKGGYAVKDSSASRYANVKLDPFEIDLIKRQPVYDSKGNEIKDFEAKKRHYIDANSHLLGRKG